MPILSCSPSDKAALFLFIHGVRRSETGLYRAEGESHERRAHASLRQTAAVECQAQYANTQRVFRVGFYTRDTLKFWNIVMARPQQPFAPSSIARIAAGRLEGPQQ